MRTTQLCAGAFALALPLLAFLPSRVSVDAGTAVHQSLEDLVTSADLALEARVLTSRVVPIGSRIDTEYTLSVDRTFWGEDLGTRTIRLPGGVLPDGSGMVVAGVPRLVPGQDVILFLTEENLDGMRMPVGLTQGRFTVATSLEGERRLVRVQGDLGVVAATGGHVGHVDGVTVLDYAGTIAEIEAACQAKSTQGGR